MLYILDINANLVSHSNSSTQTDVENSNSVKFDEFSNNANELF